MVSEAPDWFFVNCDPKIYGTWILLKKFYKVSRTLWLWIWVGCRSDMAMEYPEIERKKKKIGYSNRWRVFDMFWIG